MFNTLSRCNLIEERVEVSDEWHTLPIDRWTTSHELEHASSERESKTKKEAVGIRVTAFRR